MEFSACAKTHKDANVFLDLLRMKVSPQVPEHSSMFDLKNLLDKGEAFFCRNLEYVQHQQETFRQCFFGI